MCMNPTTVELLVFIGAPPATDYQTLDWRNIAIALIYLPPVEF